MNTISPDRTRNAGKRGGKSLFAGSIRRRSPISEAVGVELARATETVLARLVDRLQGRVYSPRVTLLNIDQVCEVTGQGTRTVYKLMSEGKFPKPQRELGKNMWRESAIISWMDANDPNLKA